MEWKVGEIRQVNGEWYQCVESDSCGKCSLSTTECGSGTKSDLADEVFGQCSKVRRSDNKHVIFKKLEKVGEPYQYMDGIYQEYKAETYPIISSKPYIGTIKGFAVKIKQNKEDMEEKKDNYDGYMDKECIHICDALNSIPNVQTTESCCGHCRDRFMIFLTCDNPHSLAIIARVFDRRYIGTSQPWHIELQTKDSGAYDYFIHSETKYDSEEVMMKDVNQIIENIEHWCDDKFASHFKGCDDKPTLAPFDINLAKAGKPVCTRDGRKARIICWDRIDSTGCNLPIVALVQCKETEVLQLYHDDGKCDVKADLDLMMLPEKKEGWVNVYKDGLLDTKSYNTKKEAFDKASPEDYVDTVKINWSE